MRVDEEIYVGNKVPHFESLKARSGLEYADMLVRPCMCMCTFHVDVDVHVHVHVHVHVDATPRETLEAAGLQSHRSFFTRGQPRANETEGRGARAGEGKGVP